jgi:hypothetical protein
MARSSYGKCDGKDEQGFSVLPVKQFFYRMFDGRSINDAEEGFVVSGLIEPQVDHFRSTGVICLLRMTSIFVQRQWEKQGIAKAIVRSKISDDDSLKSSGNVRIGELAFDNAVTQH